MWNLSKTQRNISMKKKPTHGNITDIWFPREGSWEWKQQQVGVSRCKLLRMDSIKKQVQSRDNYIQYPMIKHVGKEYKKAYKWDIPGGPMVQTPMSTAGVVGSISGQGTKPTYPKAQTE